jgi:ArsR family transcriptional regulator, arsenate/arsenite/antimonite-responsive transcriptional repressor
VTMTATQPAACCSPLASGSMSAAEAETTASVFKALSDAHRVRIVNLLADRDEAVCVCNITDSIGLSQATTSFHLKKLTAAGLLRREQRGTWAYYWLDRRVLERLRDVFDVVEEAHQRSSRRARAQK